MGSMVETSMTSAGTASFLQHADVMIASVDDSYEGGHRHTKYIIQVTERGHGHYVVSRRYSQFRVLADAVRSILSRTKTRATKSNAAHDAACLALRGFQFPKKVMHFGFLGTPSTAKEVVFDRLRQLHLYLQTLCHVLRTFHWDVASQKLNAMARDQATMLARLLHGFLAVPATFGVNPSTYVHTNPMCRNLASVYCAQHAVLQENASKKQQEFAVQAAHRAKPYATMIDTYGTALESQWHPSGTLRSSRAPSYPVYNRSTKASVVRPSIVFLHDDDPASSLHHAQQRNNHSSRLSMDDDIPLLCSSSDCGSPRDTIFLGD
ncbi:hypothetical protein SPRG_18067 [Saprolegnia parasitica CBS 223.65]|uniref:PX domain-containing protein n=1 Tax=Saprolegnia parasitica (strain CBS 223.65) TaxID=695850 RepID=A0A067BPZ9_SAPPC|nr:hypothetical protein SPRG_18067 [Saprolegnia parasitica CBS 223.65]KDO16406.1 hypothetical protein SPRG_18067 [Saprolegnia parasitica CBS 223.65]|eukprot:XP_012212885.1 hypothetical protein SPRG_18067 [Saprolegnia parasitica CBS 223.65]